MTIRRRSRSAFAVAAATAALLASSAAGASPASAAPAPASSSYAVQAASATDFGFLKRSYVRKGTRYLVLDRAELLTGAAARAARRSDGVPDEGLDFYVRNRNPKLRTVPVSPRVSVLGSQALTGSPQLEPVALRALLDRLARSPRTLPPFHLTYRKGVVVRITEQYLP